MLEGIKDKKHDIEIFKQYTPSLMYKVAFIYDGNTIIKHIDVDRMKYIELIKEKILNEEFAEC